MAAHTTQPAHAHAHARQVSEINYLEKILTTKVYDVAIETPLSAMPRLSERLGANILLKREDKQPVFSFKLRGAYNMIAHLTDRERSNGIITASAGPSAPLPAPDRTHSPPPNQMAKHHRRPLTSACARALGRPSRCARASACACGRRVCACACSASACAGRLGGIRPHPRACRHAAHVRLVRVCGRGHSCVCARLPVHGEEALVRALVRVRGVCARVMCVRVCFECACACVCVQAATHRGCVRACVRGPALVCVCVSV